ncbi:MAG: hypothetical protein A4E36_00144 [Methanoregulaceae archaeon PtaB.Bin009]|nr:MAG: hypothetical protein A4E36_00144 [Methanoregulaceae archaeon PtaB.Bin009]
MRGMVRIMMIGTIPHGPEYGQQGSPTLGSPALLYWYFPDYDEFDMPVLLSNRHHVSDSTGGTEFP